MRTLTTEVFDQWLKAYGIASQENDALASAGLFSLDALYYESPFDAPMVGREYIYQYWLRGAQTLTDKESTYEILALNKNLGVARWQSQFTDIRSGERLRLDCLFLVEFDDHDLCRVFREWWHIHQATG
jgi:hypothetical protein